MAHFQSQKYMHINYLYFAYFTLYWSRQSDFISFRLVEEKLPNKSMQIHGLRITCLL